MSARRSTGAVPDITSQTHVLPGLASLNVHEPAALAACDRDSWQPANLAGVEQLTLHGKMPAYSTKYEISPAKQQEDGTFEYAARPPLPAMCGMLGIPACILESTDAVIQLKGWGSKLSGADYDQFCGTDPNVDLNGFTEACKKRLDSALPGVSWPTRVCIQIDGDKIEDDDKAGEYANFAVFIYPLIAYLLRKKVTVSAVLFSKLQTAADAPGHAAKYMDKRGGNALADYMCRAQMKCCLYFVTFQTSDHVVVKGLQERASNYGFFGSANNQAWPKGMPRRIVAFGGGAVLDAEEAWGYAAPETTIAAYDLKRGGVESAFAKKHIGAPTAVARLL